MEVSKEGSGATKAERETARSIAMRIMESHGLKESDIPERSVELKPYAVRVPPSNMAQVFVVNIGGGFGSFEWDFDGSTTTAGTGF